MPRVIFEPTFHEAKVETEGAEGQRLVDVCDQSRAPVPFSCRSASCGTCRIVVLEGANLLEPPRGDELEILDLFGDDPRHRRLACQAVLRGGAGLLRVRAADDD